MQPSDAVVKNSKKSRGRNRPNELTRADCLDNLEPCLLVAFLPSNDIREDELENLRGDLKAKVNEGNETEGT